MSEQQQASRQDLWMQKILDALKGIEYGSVHITIHDSNITQIERVERHRYSLEKKEFSKRQKS
ncbi:DUF2292 domain-containing protein [Brevibacillus laterosporus]|nr:YezD family protein [Brevibacillus laterosporus]AYB41604.1 DUF2292 domain-containing protein [Brevibacillus laterosporus]MBM7107651.1 hypothetical protein [Brevibacillus laterosporus]